MTWNSVHNRKRVEPGLELSCKWGYTYPCCLAGCRRRTGGSSRILTQVPLNNHHTPYSIAGGGREGGRRGREEREGREEGEGVREGGEEGGGGRGGRRGREGGRGRGREGREGGEGGGRGEREGINS